MDFYLFFYDSNLKDLLLEELRLFFPELKLSFSNKEFISMKGDASYLQKLKERPLIYAKRMALFLEKKEDISENLSGVLVGEQYWIYQTIDHPCDTFDLNEVPLPERAPSRAYHKMEQAVRLFGLKLETGQQVVEIGSAPGGISYYLMELGLKLTTIDPASFDEYVSSQYPELFCHVQKSIFDVSKRDLPSHCDWVVSDLNLAGELNTAQSLRIMKLFPKLKGAFLTVKTPKTSDVAKIGAWTNALRANYRRVYVFHLPAHRREIGVLILC